MAKKTEAIKECLQFRGPPDPLRGDEIYRRVRDAAKEALDAIFDSQMPVTTSAVAAANRIQGMGNDYAPQEGMGGQSGKGKGDGYFSSMVSAVTTAVMGDGTEQVYAGHPGAGHGGQGTSSYIGGAGQQHALTSSSHSQYSGSTGTGSYSGPGGESMNRYSSSSSGGMGSGGGGGGSGMTGMGNPNFRDAREEKTWMQKAGEIATNLSSSLTITERSTKSEPMVHAHPPHSGHTGYSDYNYATNRGPTAIHHGSEGYASPGAGYQPKMAQNNALGSNVGAFQQWQQQSNTNTSPNNRGGFQSSQHTAVVPDLPSTANQLGIVGRVGGAAATGEYERSLVEPLCEAGGLKAVPPEHKLSEFLSAAQTLSPDFVGNVLLEILCDSENWPAWQSRVKALIVIGSLALNRDCVSHADWWRQQDHLDAVRGLLNDNKPTVRNQASKTSKILLGQSRDLGAGDLSAPPSTSNSPKPVLSGDNYNTSGGPGLTPQAAAVPVRQESLLDLLDDASSVPVAQSSSPLPSATSASGGGMDLFSGMSVGGGGRAPVVPSYQPQPQQGSSYPSNPSIPIATNTASLPPLPPSSQPQAPPATSQLISNSFDFLSDELPPALPPTNNNMNSNNNNSSGVAPGQGGGLFDNMNMNMTSDGNNSASLSMKTTAGSYQDDLASLSSSSSFSFMGGAGGGQVGGMGIGTMGSMGGGGSTGMRVPVSSSAISTAFTQNTPQAEKSKNDQAFSQVTNNKQIVSVVFLLFVNDLLLFLPFFSSFLLFF
jgi:hypothetical protein